MKRDSIIKNLVLYPKKKKTCIHFSFTSNKVPTKRVTEECRSSTSAKILLLGLGLLLFLLFQLLLLLLPLHRKRNPKALSMTPFGDTKFHYGVS
jgi:hypothetical protein